MLLSPTIWRMFSPKPRRSRLRGRLPWLPKKKAKTAKSKAGSSANWTPYYVKPVKRKPCNLWVVWDRMQDKQCVQIRQDASADVEILVKSWVDELNAGKIEVKVVVDRVNELKANK